MAKKKRVTTDPKIYQQALERSDGGLCEIEGCKSNDRTQLHHIIFGTGKRIPCERIESVLFLCYRHHHERYGIHGMNGDILNKKLKLSLQQTYCDVGMKEEEVRKWMGGKIY